MGEKEAYAGQRLVGRTMYDLMIEIVVSQNIEVMSLSLREDPCLQSMNKARGLLSSRRKRDMHILLAEGCHDCTR